MAYKTQWLLLLHLLLSVQILLLTLQTCRAKVPAVIIFGDSSVDTGNNNQISTMLKSNFMPYGRDFEGGKPTGRFSNGRVPSDFISEAFGCKPTVPAYLDPAYSIKDFATGVCFASAGTGYDNDTASVLSVIPLWKEVEYYKDYQKRLRAYLGEEKADEIIRDALYGISVGTNDFLENYYLNPRRMFSRRSSSFKYSSVEYYQDFLLATAGNFITELYGLGARKISLTGLPPMGCLPLERSTNTFSGSGCIEEYNRVANDFNVKLQGLVVSLNKQLPGIRVVFSDSYTILLDLIQNPSQHGFENAEVACCASGMFEMGYMCNELNPFTCTDASKYVFWDSFHPTERANAVISDYVVKNCLAQFL